jgi:hypothetical protein
MIALRFWVRSIDPIGIFDMGNPFINHEIEGLEYLTKDGWRLASKTPYDIAVWLVDNGYFDAQSELVTHKARPYKGQYIVSYSKGS